MKKTTLNFAAIRFVLILALAASAILCTSCEWKRDETWKAHYQQQIKRRMYDDSVRRATGQPTAVIIDSVVDARGFISFNFVEIITNDTFGYDFMTRAEFDSFKRAENIK